MRQGNLYPLTGARYGSPAWHGRACIDAAPAFCWSVRTEASSISLDFLQTLEHSAAAFEHVHPVVSALDDIPAFPISEDEALKFRHGQTLSITSVSAQARFASLQPDVVAITLCGEQPVALVMVKASELRPVRVFNL